MKEKDIQKLCEKYLVTNKIKFLRIPDAIYNMLNNKRNMIPDWLRFQTLKVISGVPDLTLLFRNGKYLCVELKTDKGKQSKKQELFQKTVGDDNYKVARSLKEFKEVVDPYIIENKEHMEDVC